MAAPGGEGMPLRLAEDAHVMVRIHDVSGAVQLQHRLQLGRTPDAEAARWAAARAQLPTIFDGAHVVRAPLAAAAALVLVGVVAAVGWLRAQRGAGARKRPSGSQGAAATRRKSE